MSEHLLIGIAVVFVLGIGAQWLAWRLRLPSILLLLILGFIAGPLTGILDPEALQGDWVFAFVGIAVGIILFEGGLSLRMAELREVGKAVRNLITVGVFLTWILSTAAAHYLAGFNASVSFIIGAILVVTGPTVIIPLLRHVRPNPRVGAVAKWEGITIDPIGAILALLVLEAVLLMHEPADDGTALGGIINAAVINTLEGLFLRILIGIVIGVLGAALLVLLLRRRLVPDFLQSPIAVMIVVGVYVLSDVLQSESGLLSTTLMGIMVANQKFAPVRRIAEFKEDLRVLLLGSLFILLSARLEMDALRSFVEPQNLLFLAALMIVVRPIAVILSAIGTNMTWREQAFLAWLAPRGVVAAAVASLFSFRLEELYPLQAEALVPVVFLVIVGTVAIYGLTIAPLARRLEVAQPSPQGILFIGAHTWAQKLASALQDFGYKILLVDSNPSNVEKARLRGLPVHHGNVLAEGILEELDLGGIGRLLAITPNDEVNSLAALNFSEMFDSAEVYQLATRKGEREVEGDLPQHLRGRPLFGVESTFPAISERFGRGAVIEALPVASTMSYADFLSKYGQRVLPTFIIRSNGYLQVVSDGRSESPLHPGDTVIAIIGREDVSAVQAVAAEDETDVEAQTIAR